MDGNKRQWKLKVLLILVTSFVVVFAALSLKSIFYPTKVPLPPIENITEVVIETRYTDPVVINDPEKLHLIEDFINQHSDGWHTPRHTPGIWADLQFSLCRGDEYIERFGVSKDLITRKTGSLVQYVSEEKTSGFLSELSPIFEEALYPVIPTSPTELESLSYWEDRLSRLETGASFEEIEGFLIDNNIATTYIYPGGFINVNLFVVNEGDYIDTVIAAHLALMEENRLNTTRLLGYELSEKAEFKKLSYWKSKLSELRQGASFEEIEEFIRENHIVVNDRNDNVVKLNLYTVNDHWFTGDSNPRLTEFVGAAQLLLDENKNLKSAELLGLQLSEKIDFQPGPIPPTCEIHRGGE